MSPETRPDDHAVTAWLAGAERRCAAAPDPAGDTARLLGAAGKMLVQAARWDDEAAALTARQRFAGRIESIEMAARILALTDAAAELRDVIRGALLGEDGA